MEDGRRIRWQMPFLPQYVGARQRGVAAEVDLDRGCEPAEVESPGLTANEEGGFGQVHLTRHSLHPHGVGRSGQDAHGRRIAAERLAGECVDLGDGQCHVSSSDFGMGRLGRVTDDRRGHLVIVLNAYITAIPAWTNLQQNQRLREAAPD